MLDDYSQLLLNVRLAGDHLYGKLLFTLLSLVMSVMLSFCAALFPRDVLEILDLIGSDSGVFLPTLPIDSNLKKY